MFVALLGVATACTSTDGAGTSGSDVVRHDAAARDAATRDAATHDAARLPSRGSVDAAFDCASDDVLCPTRGYAHFTIPNAAESGLDDAARYDVRDQVVVDEISGLIWERTPSHEYLGWEQAKTRCAELMLDGRDDFRLPGRIELVTILDFEQLPVAASVFDDVVAEYHWTSSPASFVEGSAYSVYFGAGETTIANASPGRALSWCVAGEVRAAYPQFRREGAEVFDRGSGLHWERLLAPSSSWEKADERCSDLGMRLPSVAELQSIVDERAYDPAMDLQVFPDEFPDPTLRDNWTSSSRGEQRWTVDFTDGKTYADRLLSEQLASRCVR